MLIAGCGGGGGSSGAPRTTSSGLNLAQVQFELDFSQPAGAKRGRAPASVKRRPSYVSPGSAYASLAEASGGATVYQTTFALGAPACSPAAPGPGYVCNVGIPIGTYTIYGSLYDSSMRMLSTNLYTNPQPTTINANGSSPNIITIYGQGVVYSVFMESPHRCVFAHPHTIPVDFLDAANYAVIGPLANPVSLRELPIDGAGTGALDFQATVGGSTQSLNNAVVTDTTIYTSPFLNVSGSEGSIFINASSANLGVHFGSRTYTPPGDIAETKMAAANFLAFGLTGGGLYEFAVEQATNNVIPCSGPLLTDRGLTAPNIVGSLRDGTNNFPEIAVADGPNVFLIGGESSNVYLNLGVSPPVAEIPTYATFTEPAGGSIVNLLES
ncbi:MAG: hypothetical protein JO349_04545, partial [Candidatus Eremiobacteraeota bacterium]|nr:hypothetical protein [Candidatus Eremiobacteraeota bacterium]